MLARVGAAEGGHSPTVGHAPRHLHVVCPARPADVRVRQHKLLEVQPDLTDVVVHGSDHEAAHGAGHVWGAEHGPVLAGLGVTVALQEAARPEPPGAAAGWLAAPSPALGAGVTDTLDSLVKKKW